MSGSQTVCLYSGVNTGNRILPLGLALFIVAAAVLCSALDSSSATSLDEVRVLNQENVIGPTEVELLADCNRSDSLAEPLFSHQCPEND